MMFVCLLLPLGAGAQSTHWTMDPYAFRYDMTAFVSLTVNGTPLTDYADYEIAAFCGDDCRGVANIQTVRSSSKPSVSYGYLRIRSNQEEGEVITFKVYNKVSRQVDDIDDVSLTFHSQGVVGMPSNPLQLNAAFVGDVNGDGYINLNDLNTLIDVITGKTIDDETRTRANVNSDSNIDIGDLITITNMLVN
jgi:hypothetical protein